MNWLELALPTIKDILIIIVITVLVPLLRAAIKWWRDLVLENWIKELIEDGVLFAQEKYWDSVGEERFELAKQWIVDKLNEKGIKVSMDWLEGLIDATVRRLRDEFNETWYREE